MFSLRLTQTESLSMYEIMRIFPAHSTTKKANYWESNKGRPAETINTKVSGKVNLIFYKLNLFPIFLVDKEKKKQKNCHL